MANEYFDLNIRVKATSEDAALELVKRQIGDVKAKLNETKESTDSLSGSVKEMVAAFLTLEGAKQVVGALWQGMKDAAQESREMRGIGAILKDIGADAEKGSKQVEAFASQMMEAGFSDEQTRASLLKLLPVTRDLGASLGLLDVAYGLNITRGKEVNETISLMASLLIGGPRALRTAQMEYGVVLDQNMPKQEQFKDAMRQIIAQGSGVADKTRDATAQINSLGMVMGKVQEGVGGRFLAQIQAIGAGFGYSTKKIIDFGVEAVSTFGRLSIALATLGQSEVLMWIMGKKKVAPAASGQVDMMSGHKPGAGLMGMLNFRAEEKEDKKEISANLKKEDKITADVLRESKERMRQAEKERKWRILQEELFAKKHKQIFKGIEEFNDEMAQEYSDGLQRTSDKLAQAEEDKQKTKEMAFQAGMILGDAAFKQNKAWLYAQDIATTYMAATTAIGPPPYGYGPTIPGYVAMGLAIATGLANAASIASAERGFDIPAGLNPIVQAHSQEMVLPREQADVIRALARQGNITNNNNARATTIVNMQAFGPAEAEAHMRAFERRRRPAAIGLDRTIAQRNIVRAGSKRGPRYPGRA